MVIKIHNSKTVTDKQAYWMSPSNSGTFLQPEMLFNIDFRSHQFKKKSIEKHVNSYPLYQDGLHSPPLKRKSPITKTTSSQMDIFFEYYLQYYGFSKDMLNNLGQSHLKNLYSDSCLNMPFQYLQKNCNEIFESISISQDEALNIESQTRSQSKSQKWYEQVYIYQFYH